MNVEIGPGRHPLEGFVGVDVIGDHDVRADGRALPFGTGSVDMIYASHVIEHVPWFDTDALLGEWRRVLRRGGRLEVWTVDALRVAKELVAVEEGGPSPIRHDGWRRHNPEADPYKWIAGRIFAYGSAPADPNWHRALFTPRSLCEAFERAGFRRVSRIDGRPRGYDHRWINLGVEGEAC